MTTTKRSTKLLALLLTLVTVFTILPLSAQAASVGDGSKTCTVSTVERNYFLTTTAGTRLGATAYTYTTNDGLTGPAFCIDHGLNYTSKSLPITGKYTSSPKAAGAFANGYPQHTVSIFLGLYLRNNPILEGLTEDEFAYATQLAVWSTLGQLAVEGTAFTAGRETLAQPTGDTQQMRVFRAVQLILMAANGWDRVYQTGMYIRTEADELGGNISIPADMTLEYAADNEQYGLKREVIGGISYYTREYIFASSTSTYYSGYNIELWATGAPAGAIFTDTANNELARGSFRETATWTLPVTSKGTTLNSNGYEYVGTAKLCIPVDTVPNSGEITINCGAYVMQYEIYLAYNETTYEQSYIIADPSKGTQTANAVLNWGSEITEKGALQVLKINGGGAPLQGASFTLSGTDGRILTGTTDATGTIKWEQLDPSITYTLTETEAPAGYAIVDPINIRIQAARTNYVTVRDSTEKQLIVRKIDRQNGYSLAGATIKFEQIDGSFQTTKVTDHAGMIAMTADELPIGSYKVYEVSAPEGYEVDPAAQTVDWNGRNDVTLTFENTRKPTLIIYKCDEGNNFNLPGATFAVYKNGQHITDVTTNDNGLAYVSGVTTGYYTVKETVAPAGYVLDPTEHSVYVDAYNPATADDPRIVVTNRAKPSLLIQKYDTQTNAAVPGCTFEVYKDAALVGTYTTDPNGQILLTNLDPGTYLAKEVAANPGYVVNSTPQQIEIEAGDGLLRLVFLNTVKPGIHLIKLDSETYAPLAGARFKVELIGGSFSREYTTNADGEIDLTGLTTGAYKVTELAAPDGYLIDDDVRTIQLNAGENGVFVFTDTKKPSLTVLKYDPAADKYLPGAIFRIAKIEDGSHYLDRITGTDGKLVLTGLEPGVYSVKEIEAPGGYVLDGTEYHVELFASKDSQIVVSNAAKPDLKIIKTDALTGKPVEGATFTVKKADSSTLTTVTTGPDGTVLVEDLDPGVYVVTEQSVPDAYILDPTPQTITLEPNKTCTVQFQNYPKSSLTVYKVDSITHSPVEKARFHIWYAGNGSAAGTLTDKGYYYSDADGVIKLTGLQEGWYRVTEVEAPTGYALKDPSTQELYVREGTQNEMTFENVPLSALIIKKLDADSGEALQGAKFQVRYLAGASGTGGTVIGTYTTNVNGVILITGLKVGTYVVEETKAPDGYEIDGTPQTVYLSGKEQDVVTVEFADGKHGGLIVQKLDSATKEPLPGAQFKITTSDGTFVANYGGAVSSNGIYTTDENGQIRIINLKPGTYVVTETKAPDGYVLDGTPQTVKVDTSDTQTLTFTNTPIGGLVVIKTDYDSGARIKGAQFEVRKANGEIVGSYTTGSTGAFTVPGLASGWYIVTETRAPSGYLLDATEHRVEVKDGATSTLNITNKKACSILIHKVDANTGKGIYGVTFVLYDSGRNPIDQVTTDQYGYAYVDGELTAGKYYLRELEPADGYIADTQYKTVYVKAGTTTTVEWENTAITGQIQITKYAAEYNSVTGDAAGTKLKSAVFEIVRYKSGVVVGYITTDARGVAASAPLPLGRYIIREVTAPAYYQLSSETFDVDLEFAGQIIRLAAYNKPAELGVSITKTGIKEVLAGSSMSYTIKVANTSNVALDSFYWHDRFPTDACIATALTTGTYSQRLNYRVLVKTNYRDYMVLASDLLTTNNYSFALTALPLMAGEVVTDIYYDFGTVPAGFQSKTSPTITVAVGPKVTSGYYIINRADVGGKYQGTWETANASWITIVRNLAPIPVIPLPKTGY